MSPDARSAARGAGLLTILQFANRFVGLGFVLLATHLATPSEFGRYSIVVSVSVFAGFLSDFGTTSAATKMVSTGLDPDSLIGAGLLPCLVLGLGGWAAGIAGLIGFGFPKTVVGDFLIYGAMLPFDACLTTIIGALNGSGRLTNGAWIGAFRLTSGAAGGAVALLAAGSIRAALLGMAVVAPVALALAMMSAIRLGVWSGQVLFRPAVVGGLVRAALPFAAISGLGILASRFDVALIAVLYSRGQTALYDVALRTISAPIALVGILEGPTLYFFSRRLAMGDRDGVKRAFHRLGRILLLFALPLSVGAVILGHDLVVTLFGPSYSAAALPLMILGGQVFLMFVTGLQGLLLAAIPRMKGVVIVVSVLNALGIAIQATLTVAFGVPGTAAAIPVCQCLAIVVQATYLRHKMEFIAIPLPSMGMILGTIFCGLIAFVTRGSLVVSIVSASVVYVAVLAVTGAVSSADIALVRVMASRRRDDTAGIEGL